MTSGTRTAIVCTVIAQGFLGCGSYSSQPTAPAPVPQPQPAIAQPVPSPPAPGYALGYVLTGVSLSGVVTERTAAGQTPLEDVTVYCDACGPVGHSWRYTDKDGRYSFHGDIASGGGVWLAANSATPLFVEKSGFGAFLPPADERGQVSVKMSGNTEFNVQLVRR